MEYTNAEKEALSLLQRADFKSISKNEILDITSRIREMRPDVAKEIIAQFPEFSNLMKTELAEYKEILGNIIDSDDASIKEYFAVANKTLEGVKEGRKQQGDIVSQVLSDCSKVLDNPNLSNEDAKEILEREIEFAKFAADKEDERLKHEKDIEESVNKKDTEKRELNMKIINTVSATCILVAGIAIVALGGDFKFKLPKK